MRIWLALIVAPLLALTDQSVAFALVGWSCEHQTALPVHASHALFLALTTGVAASGWLAWSRTALVPLREGDAVRRRHFLAGIAFAVATLSALAIVAMWIPTWMISACLA